MRTPLTPAARARREATTVLVRRRVDTLFGPQPLRAVPPGFPASFDPTLPVPPVVPPVGPAVHAVPALPVPPTPDPSPAARVTHVAHVADPARAASPHSPSPPRVRPSFALALKERWDLDRRAVIGLAVLLVLALGYGVQHFWAGRPESMTVPGPAVEGTALAAAPSGTSSPAPSDPSATAIADLVVDVSGKVHSPGLRTLPPGSRVQDALTAAGGPLPGTDLTGLNLARKVNDGEEIIVGPAPPGAPGGPGGARAAGPLSLNAATEAQLDALPGVGPVLAGRIIQFRQQHGGFQSVDQLREVPGFGERRLQDLRAQLRP